MPLHRRLPKRGFNEPLRARTTNEVNLGRIQQAVEAGKLDGAKGAVTVEALDRRGRHAAKARDGVKILGSRRTQGQAGFRGGWLRPSRPSRRSKRLAAASRCGTQPRPEGA